MMNGCRVTQNRAFYFTVEFWVLLLVGFLPTVASLVANLWVMNTAGTNMYVQLAVSDGTIRWLIIDFLPGILGVLTVSVIAFVGIIDIGRVKWNHVLMAFLLVLLCDEQFGYKLVDISETDLEDAGWAVSVFKTWTPFFSLVTVWRWFILCIYLVAVSGRIRKANIVLMVVAAILIGWSVFMTIFDGMFFRMLCVHELLLSFTHGLSSWFYRTTWLNRLVVLCAALASGMTQWRWSRTVLCILVKTVPTALLVSPFIFQFNMGLGGLAVSEFFRIF